MKVGVLFMTLTSGQNNTGDYVGKYEESSRKRALSQAQLESQKGQRYRELKVESKLAVEMFNST